jgi:hypothetical protein
VDVFGSPAGTSRLVAVIGITTEIAPIEEKIGTPIVTRIQGVVFTSGSIDGTRIVAVRSGVGKVNAAMAATLLADHFSPSVVIFTGTAGSVDTELNPADVSQRGGGAGLQPFWDSGDRHSQHHRPRRWIGKSKLLTRKPNSCSFGARPMSPIDFEPA